MAESFVNGYQRLFEIRLLHHYWLDQGATIFDAIASQETRERRLSAYDMRSFLALAPTADTASAIAGMRGVCKETALGAVVAVPSSAVIAPDTVLQFMVRIKDSGFYNYTALTLQPQKTAEIFHKPQEKLYRYKENVPVLSNLSGASRTFAGGKELFLSRDFPALAPDDPVESLVAAGGALLQLISDQPGAGTRQLAADLNTVPVYVNQSDVPPIVPPPGLTGAPARGIELSADLRDDLFALVRLAAVRGDDGDFSFIDGAGHARSPHPVYQVRFRNRSTTWRYLDNSTGIVESQEPGPLPLTFFGNAGTRQKPSAGFVKPEKSAGRITDIISEIFI